MLGPAAGVREVMGGDVGGRGWWVGWDGKAMFGGFAEGLAVWVAVAGGVADGREQRGGGGGIADWVCFGDGAV